MKRIFIWLLVASVILCMGAVSETSAIQKGSSGGTITAIQKILCSLNYLSEEYVTGNYDDMTELAVLAFQLDHGIAPTGIADSETQQAITGSMKTTGDNGQSNTENAAGDYVENTIEETTAEPDNSISEADNTISDLSLRENEIPFTGTTIVDDFECSIKELNWYSSKDFDFDVIEKEKEFEHIVIVLSERNTSNDTENAPMLNVLSADGQQCNSIPILSLYKNQYKINFGATMANSTAEAYFIYKIPAGSQSFKLQILSNGFGSNSDCFVFNRNDIK